MNKLSVGQRLGLLVGLPLAVILLLVISSLSSFSAINQGVGRIYDDRVVPLAALKRVNDGYTGIINAINKADNGLQVPRVAVTAIRGHQKAIREHWAIYAGDGQTLSAAEREQADHMEALFDAADEPIDEALSILAPLGDSMQFDSDGDSLIAGYNGDLYEYVDPISERLAILIELQLSKAAEERAAAQQLYDNTFRSFIAIAVIAGLIMVGSGFWVSRTISVPLNKLRQAIENAERNRDLTVRVDTNQRDEIGQVAIAFQSMIDRFRDIIGNVRDTSAQLQTYAQTLSNTTELTREGVAVQTRETDQVATASTEMTHAIEEVSRNAHQAAEAANKANQETESGNKVLEEAIRSINNLSSRIDQASDVINRVETDSSAIGTVLDVIRGIAEQTNLLALNAAIEAARAGEQGRGFAVVADEVRSLAQRTQESTQEIQQMIERLQAGAQAAVNTMAEGTSEMQRTTEQAGKASSSLAAIRSAVALISDMNTQIASATEEQMAVSQEISRNVVNISDVAKSSEHSVEEIDQASTELKNAAANLSALVNAFST
ncbi:MAG TPA: methyl-accepting chemotaxis protein [Spongiibacteraceae bacterium]|jgi:methyl-accepting chemotaxis protein|nr:methyl-accepting chemotaxis protein [Spongiibacteraceae bacterium]HUH36460.1 methyl-accepting chemotaxis protein [Spongiibacteraceae bacterium]